MAHLLFKSTAINSMLTFCGIIHFADNYFYQSEIFFFLQLVHYFYHNYYLVKVHVDVHEVMHLQCKSSLVCEILVDGVHVGIGIVLDLMMVV